MPFGTDSEDQVTTCPMKPTLPYVVAEFGVPMTTPDDHPDLDPMARRVAEPATITRAVLRRLLDLALTHTANPALARLPDDQRTVAGWRALRALESLPAPPRRCRSVSGLNTPCGPTARSRRFLPTMLLDLHDPGLRTPC